MFADPGTPCCPRWSSNQGGRRTAATTWRIALTMTAHRHGSMLRWAVLAKIEPGVYETHACDNRRAMRRLTTIVGPTASGKTTLAVELAEQIDAEIIGADSRQVYRRMDIGTAKPTPDERTAARHHLIDVVDPDEPFSLGRWLDLAKDALEEVWSRGKEPLLVGGTGQYVWALLEGWRVPRVPPDGRLRAALPSMSGIGYREVCEYLAGEIDLETAVERTKTGTHRLARHQNSWFKAGDERIRWIEAGDGAVDEAVRLAEEFFRKTNSMEAARGDPVR